MFLSDAGLLLILAFPPDARPPCQKVGFPDRHSAFLSNSQPFCQTPSLLPGSQTFCQTLESPQTLSLPGRRQPSCQTLPYHIDCFSKLPRMFSVQPAPCLPGIHSALLSVASAPNRTLPVGCLIMPPCRQPPGVILPGVLFISDISLSDHASCQPSRHSSRLCHQTPCLSHAKSSPASCAACSHCGRSFAMAALSGAWGALPSSLHSSRSALLQISDHYMTC